MDKRIGAQFYTIRDYIQTIEDFDASCKKIAEIGYQTVQISGTPLGAKEMRQVLDSYGLQAVTSHRSFDDFKANLDEIVDYNKTLGITLCGVGSMPWDSKGDYTRMTAFIKEVNQISQQLAKEGLQFGYHNHAFEFQKFNGRTIMDMLIEETNPETFHFIVDTYWIHYGGIHVEKFLRRLGKRAEAVHLKDIGIQPYTNEVTMYEVGRGNLDWDEILLACEEAGVKWALVEQDICPGDPFDSLKQSYEYLAGKGFC